MFWYSQFLHSLHSCTAQPVFVLDFKQFLQISTCSGREKGWNSAPSIPGARSEVFPARDGNSGALTVQRTNKSLTFYVNDIQQEKLKSKNHCSAIHFCRLQLAQQDSILGCRTPRSAGKAKLDVSMPPKKYRPMMVKVQDHSKPTSSAKD